MVALLHLELLEYFLQNLFALLHLENLAPLYLQPLQD
jgi:hypothetical protein